MNYKLSDVAQPTFVEELVNYLKDKTDADFSVPKIVASSFGEATIQVTLYETVSLTWEKEREFRNLFYEYCQAHKGEVVAVVDLEKSEWDGRSKYVPKTYPYHELKMKNVDIRKRSKQSSIKVSGSNWKQVLEQYAEEDQGKFVFGVSGKWRSNFDTFGDVAILKDGKLRYYKIPSSGLFVQLSQELSVGRSSQEVIAAYPYVEFELPVEVAP